MGCGLMWVVCWSVCLDGWGVGLGWREWSGEKRVIREYAYNKLGMRWGAEERNGSE